MVSPLKKKRTKKGLPGVLKVSQQDVCGEGYDGLRRRLPARLDVGSASANF